MASHGVPRSTATHEKTEESRQKELAEIKEYQSLVETVNREVAAKNYTPTLLQQTAELLKKNPEYYTVWNDRRRIYANEFDSLNTSAEAGQLSQKDRTSQILDIIKLDLQFLFPLLLRFPKCYWIWNHRLWLLNSATEQLPAAIARKIWEEELGLVGKMLARDSRNFHGWGYRRMVIASLESPQLNPGTDGQSMARSELEYTTKMIGTNLSNFSAWHNRTKLILRYLAEKNSTDEERKEMLDEEFALIHRALFDPYDASLWSYYQNLLCVLDPITAPTAMAPNLSSADRLVYLQKERAFVEEMLEADGDDDEAGDDGGGGDGVDDCKWIYQRLIDIVLIGGRVRRSQGPESVGSGLSGTGDISSKDRADVRKWLKKLHTLDPLRRGRWKDLENSLAL